MSDRHSRDHSHELLDFHLDNLPLAVVELDRDGRISRWSSRAERMFGWSRDEVLGKPLAEAGLVHPDDLKSVIESIDKMISGDITSGFTRVNRNLTRSGKVLICEWHNSARVDEHGRPVSVLSFASDITGRLKAEEQLRRSQALLEIAGQAARLGAWRVNVESGRVIWSDEVAAIHEEPPGTSPSLEEGFSYYAPENRDRIREIFTACATRGTPFDEELQLITARGNRIWARTIGRPVRNPKGEVVAVQGAIQDISDRKAAEEALRLSEERYRNAAEASQAALWDYDMATDRVEFSEAFRDMLGYQRLEDTPANLEDYMTLMHPQDRVRIRETAERLVAGETDDRASAEFRLLTQDGEYRWFQSNNKVIRDDDGNAVRRLGSIIDIHERKVAQEKNRELAERLSSTLESITDAFFTLDRDWRITFLNRQAVVQFRRPRDELLGRVLWEEFPEAVDLAFYRGLHEAAEKRQTVEFEEYYPPFDSWFGVTAYPTGEGVAVYFRDVTERRRARQRLAEQAELLDKARDAIIVRDLDHRISFWNRGAERIYGWTAEQAVGKHGGELLYEDTTEYHEAFEKVLEQEGWEGQLVQQRKDGKAITVHSHCTLVLDADGKPRAVLSINTDITDQVELEEQLRQAQRLESIGQLTGGVAHDFNNLLTVILGNAELLAEHLESNPRLQHLAEMTRAAARRGAELTNRLLAFARRQTLEPQSTDIAELVNGMRPLLSRSIAENIEMRFVHAPDLWRAEIDPAQLESSLLNLVLNARDAMPEGGQLTIETSNTELDRDDVEAHTDVRPGDYVQIAVSDTGKGIAREHLARMFEPFFTTKKKGKGTGLGLPMVYGFVKQSNGHINVSSTPSQGTTVRMYLPRSRRPADDGSLPVAREPDLRGTERVLVVEDDELVREHAERLLGQLGYRVSTAAGGREALDLLKSSPGIDLLFTDVIMPGEFDGPALVREVRKLYPEVRVLFTSGYTEDAVIDRDSPDTGLCLLQKPYRRIDLARKVREALDGE